VLWQIIPVVEASSLEVRSVASWWIDMSDSGIGMVVLTMLARDRSQYLLGCKPAGIISEDSSIS
jgi:hypothetical protein